MYNINNSNPFSATWSADAIVAAIAASWNTPRPVRLDPDAAAQFDRRLAIFVGFMQRHALTSALVDGVRARTAAGWRAPPSAGGTGFLIQFDQYMAAMVASSKTAGP